MKRTCMMLVALALILGLAQCKKNTDQNTNENEDEKVFITLNVNQGNGSRLDVDPPHVVFQTGDKIYVASNGVYVGYLEYNGTNFDGEISNATEGQPLYFYLLGNVTPAETLTSGSTTSCSVVISDQTANKPVIACNKSNENFGTTNTFTSTLRNKCALVKFNVTTSSTAATCITGFNNKVTVNFLNNTLTPSKDGNGVITLPAGSGERWAILLPQEALPAGYAYSGSYEGTYDAIPAISNNSYMQLGIDVMLDHAVGAINGLFSVGSQQVYFSRGNLQYQASTGTWRFAEHQWDYVGGTGYDGYGVQEYGTVYENGIKCSNDEISQTYSGWIDLFGWGTSGYHYAGDSYNEYYQPWSTSESQEHHLYNWYGYGPSTCMTDPNLTGTSANYDWGVYNPISNGGNIPNLWRTLTRSEWDYVFNHRITTSGIRYAMANVSNVNGVILLPDDWSSSTYSLSNTNGNGASYSSNTLTASQWNTLEQAGAVFLPAADHRFGNSIDPCNLLGYYWSTSGYFWYDDDSRAYDVLFYPSHVETNHDSPRPLGQSVRLVRVAEN